MEKVITENSNPQTKDIDLVSTYEIVKKINEEDMKVAQIVQKELAHIALAVDLIVEAFKIGARLFYFGAGTSGRMGVLDASECPPTFGVNPDMVQGIIAGGDRALRYAIEGAEDDFELGLKDSQKLNKEDITTLISASGNPKYLLGVAQGAKKINSKIIAITSNPDAKILKYADVKIVTVVGAEAISGSSRMKSATAQKMILNMLSTASMVKIGKTYENFMIDVKPTNEKLKKRAIQIVCDISKKSEKESYDMLLECDWNVKAAIVCLVKKTDYKKALKLLCDNDFILRKALM